MHLISKVTLQPQNCQTGMWAAQGSQSGPQRLLCEMPGTSTEGKDVYLHQAQEQGQSRLRGTSPGQAPSLSARALPWGEQPWPWGSRGTASLGAVPQGSTDGPNLLAGGRKADCSGAALALGLWPWLLWFLA